MHSAHALACTHHGAALVGPSEDRAVYVNHIGVALLAQCIHDPRRAIAYRAVHGNGPVGGHRIQQCRVGPLWIVMTGAADVAGGVLFGGAGIEQERALALRLVEACSQGIG